GLWFFYGLTARTNSGMSNSKTKMDPRNNNDKRIKIGPSKIKRSCRRFKIDLVTLQLYAKKIFASFMFVFKRLVFRTIRRAIDVPIFEFGVFTTSSSLGRESTY